LNSWKERVGKWLPGHERRRKWRGVGQRVQTFSYKTMISVDLMCHTLTTVNNNSFYILNLLSK
jgi:hypothetical protein